MKPCSCAYSRELQPGLAVGKRVPVGAPAPRSEVHLVDRDGRVVALPGAAPSHPGLVVPVVRKIGHGRRGAAQLGGERERVGLLDRVALACLDPELVVVAGLPAREGSRPHTARGDGCERVHARVPAVAVADERHRRRVGGPHRELVPRPAGGVRAEPFVEPVVPALVEQMEIVGGQPRHALLLRGPIEAFECVSDRRERIQLLDRVRGPPSERLVPVAAARDVLRFRFQPEILERREHERGAAATEPGQCRAEHRAGIDRVVGLGFEVAGRTQRGEQCAARNRCEIVPPCRERREVVGVDAGERARPGRLRDRVFLVGKLELRDPDAERAVAAHRAGGLGGNGAEVLADDRRAMALRDQADRRPVLLGRVVHVRAVGGRRSGRDHPEAVESHDVVEAQRPRVLQLFVEARGEVRVAVGAGRARVEGREAPVLTGGLEAVGRRADVGAGREQVGVGGDVVPVAVGADRQVDVERLSARDRARSRAARADPPSPIARTRGTRRRRARCSRSRPGTPRRRTRRGAR